MTDAPVDGEERPEGGEPRPATVQSLTHQLGALGVEAGATLIVHTSLSALGWVVGGVQDVVAALHAAVGPAGTVVMPVQSWQLCDPALLQQTDAQWWPLVREHLPVYDPASTPSKTMGTVAEHFRTLPGTLRSAHPHRSFAAAGRLAAQVVAQHDLSEPMGEGSPLAVLYDVGARVLLLGVSAAKCTALHLAEHRCEYPGKHRISNGAPVLVDGQRRWRSWQELAVSAEDFEQVAEDFAAATGLRRSAPVGQGVGQLLPVRELVDHAAGWFPTHRRA
ncbi:AAC(3) family N-acetyltransferase [Paenibacillus sp. TRM 82003]|uniref:aminoglycoside N(3)-acetyltransferase n=1 Tax=Kineococcus sp. TRM81007 TaxID=2925831 RepID=UPI001F5A602B|nr:AAC(3) family N-acetyltransferase [Kineococcus sp. TRM81007]MCI2237786.1 AAC(3) family N-acetyltransferase [Kineococcus sp. TRM81007]MCI3921806.1 AAC(3) family N-acetyltransferase [Paenibacillus sp. TRM 82003]